MFNSEGAVISTEWVHVGLYLSSFEITGERCSHLAWLPCEV